MPEKDTPKAPSGATLRALTLRGGDVYGDRGWCGKPSAMILAPDFRGQVVESVGASLFLDDALAAAGRASPEPYAPTRAWRDNSAAFVEVLGLWWDAGALAFIGPHRVALLRRGESEFLGCWRDQELVGLLGPVVMSAGALGVLADIEAGEGDPS